MKEIVARPPIYKIWKTIEQYTVPKFEKGYTVNQPIADEFRKMYGVEYGVIRNVPRTFPLLLPKNKKPYFIYQGAVNEGRCFETLIPAMKFVDAPLIICGDGNFMDQTRELVRLHNLESKVIFKGRLLPAELREVTINAWAGVTLFEPGAKSNYYSLANRFFDYIAAGIPQLCVNYPVYAGINKENEVALLTDNTDPDSIAKYLNQLLNDLPLYEKLQQNCLVAREKFTWEKEERLLINFYKDLMS
jgi:glycosyltransferase involved in cell wall biosynthesis